MKVVKPQTLFIRTRKKSLLFHLIFRHYTVTAYYTRLQMWGKSHLQRKSTLLLLLKSRRRRWRLLLFSERERMVRMRIVYVWTTEPFCLARSFHTIISIRRTYLQTFSACIVTKLKEILVVDDHMIPSFPREWNAEYNTQQHIFMIRRFVIAHHECVRNFTIHVRTSQAYARLSHLQP